MAKYEVTHACGHTHTYQLYGKTADRERKMAWLAEQDCPECAKRARDEQHKVEAEEAAKATEGLNLTELTGTPKQVAWANTIRGKFIELLQKEEGVNMDNALIVISLYTSASWWIDNRGSFDSKYTLINMANERKDEVMAKINGTAKAEEHAAKEEVKAEEPAKHEATAPAPAKKAVKKSDWGKVAVNVQNIKNSTVRSYLINMPHSSEYDGYSVWVSRKLMREGRHSYERFMSIKADMEFELKKYSDSWSHDKVHGVPTKTITAAQMAEAFGGYVDGAGYSRQASIKEEDEEVVIEKHVPETLAPVDVEADPELVR